MIEFPSRQSCYSQSRISNGFPRFTLLFTAALLAMLPAVPAAHAQLLFGSIVGNVVDTSGAAVPAAVVRVTQLETNESRETKTNESGGFILSTVHTGTYPVSVMKEGSNSA